MNNQPIRTKAELLHTIEHAWTHFNRTLDGFTEAQMTTPRDDHGWTAKDHVINVVAWERSVVFLLQGQPRHAGLGVSEALYLTDDEDAINATMYEQHKHETLAEVRAQLRDVHAHLLALVAPLSDADLHLPYRHYLPDEPGDGDGPAVINVILGNTAHHYGEHLGWIEALITEHHT